QAGRGQSNDITLECEGMSKRLRADLFVQFRSLADLVAQTGTATEEYRLSGIASPFSNLTASQMVSEMLLNYFYLDVGRKSFNFIAGEETLTEADGYKKTANYSNLYINKDNVKKFAVVRDINTRAFDYIELNDFNNYFFTEYYRPLELIDNMKNKFMYFFYQKNDGTFVFDDFNRTISSISEKEYLYKINLDKVFRFNITQDDSTLLTRVRIVPEFQFDVGVLTQIETREDIIPDVEERYGIRTYETKTIRGVSSIKEIYNYARSYLIRNNDQYESMSIEMLGDPLYDLNDNVLIEDYMTIFMINKISRNIDSTGSNTMTLDLRFSRKPLNIKEMNRIENSETASVNALTDATTKVYKFNYLDQYVDTASEEKVLYGLYWQIIPRLLYSEGRIPTG
ncbi:MAG: hypothetical protein PHE15_06585, partial [Dehalococcoidales bacterium]|nr:hypothetical protein [Dehalococcoidales bacterium]